MSTFRDVLDLIQVKPGKQIRLRDFDPAWAGDLRMSKKKRKTFAKEVLSEDITALSRAQDVLHAADTYSVLTIFQAMDAAGKDSTIRHVMSGVDPQACQAISFKIPSEEELQHHFLWRYSKAMPPRGHIGIFNRSYYEEVLVVKVHPELLARQTLPGTKLNKGFWQERYEDINHFERHLTRNGTIILKFFLHLSPAEQQKRFLARLNDPDKRWKFSAADLKEREHWDAYMDAYEKCLSATNTLWAPWCIVPADHKWATRAIVSHVITQAIEGLHLKYPEVPAEQLRQLAAAKKRLKESTKE